MAKVDSDFIPCCPHCYGSDFQPVALRRNLLTGALERIESRGIRFLPVLNFDDNDNGEELFFKYETTQRFPYHGEELYHCNQCGKVFEREAAIELRLLEPVELPTRLLYMAKDEFGGY